MFKLVLKFSSFLGPLTYDVIQILRTYDPLPPVSTKPTQPPLLRSEFG